MKKNILLSAFILLESLAISQPQPGDVFREYIWTTPDYVKGEKFLRVGGRFDYRLEPEKFPAGYIVDGYITLPYQMDMDQAINAEIQVEKDLCHEGTRGLSIKINESVWFEFPEPDSIPFPARNYLHHTYPVIQIPMDIFGDPEIKFQLRVDSAQEWNWPQNLLYSVIFRLYYDRKKILSTPSLAKPHDGDQLGEYIEISLDETEKDPIRSAIFVGKYLDVNYEGDGIYDQWHYSFYRGERRNHLGYAVSRPFEIEWDTEWIPDQPFPFEIAAIVRFENELFYFTESVKGLTLNRRRDKILLCKPMDQPEKWTTRAGEFASHFMLEEDPEKIQGYQLVWASWSPCYANGIYINGHLVYIREGPCYDFKFHRVILENNIPLRKGFNVIKTGQTPRDREGNRVHGMDVQWPGIMVLVKLKK